MKRTNLAPAYGRDYKSKREVLADLKQGKDFIITNVFDPSDGKPINLPALMAAGFDSVQIRYSRLRKVMVVQLSMLKGAA